MRYFKNNYLSLLNDHLVSYPTPLNLTYFWGYGFLAACCLGLQIVSGIFLVMHYVPQHLLAFESTEHIMRDVVYGSDLRYIHAVGASFFFIIVYTHLARALFFGSFIWTNILLWFSGIVIFFLMMATAFLGYVLPWGQMSFWGATVITNLFTVIPFLGPMLAELIWGNYSVSSQTINRFFSFHFTIPFILAGLAILHLILLHKSKKGSTNPVVVSLDYNNKISFSFFFFIKDFLGLFFIAFFFFLFVFFYPDVLGHPDNYKKADAMVTPAHIVPEWYFLPFYAILRCIPSKIGGVLCMLFSLLVLALLPFLTKYSYSNGHYAYITHRVKYNFFFKFSFFFLLVTVFSLGWLGSAPVEEPYTTYTQFFTFYYFLYFLVLLPSYYTNKKLI